MAATTPYIGLSSFKEADAEWFFGRETEKRILIANLRVSAADALLRSQWGGKELTASSRCGIAAGGIGDN